MEAFISTSPALSEMLDRLALGFESFGSHAVWLWILPLIWGIAACMIWNTMQSEEEALDRVYVAKAEQNLPSLKELRKERSTEILEIRTIDLDKKRNGQNRKL